jgi:hypothetical protein
MKKCLREKCPNEFEPNKPKQVFCSAKCRVYYSRENPKTKVVGLPLPKDYVEVKQVKVIKDFSKPTNLVEPQKPMGSQKSNFTINTGLTKNKGESGIDFAIRKAEWEKNNLKK